MTDVDSLKVTTALVQGDSLTIATDDQSLSLPTLIAVDIAAETIRLLLDEDDITNGPGLSLSEWLGDEDAEELGPSWRGSLGQKDRHSQRRTVNRPLGGFPVRIGGFDWAATPGRRRCWRPAPAPHLSSPEGVAPASRAA